MLINAIVAFLLLVIGALSLFKGSLGSMARSLTSWIPFGSPKLWAIVLIAVGLVFGGIAGAGVAFDKVKGAVSSASVSGAGTTSSGSTVAPLQLGKATLLSITEADTYTSNLTFRADPANRQHEYIDALSTEDGAASFNATINVPKIDTDLEHDKGIECYAAAQSFRSETSTTDSNTYYILATSTTASQVPGYTWQQTVYLNDGAVATTSSNQEKTILTFARGTAQRTLGVYATLPGATVFGYLNNQTSKDVDIYCGGNQLFKFTITKIAA